MPMRDPSRFTRAEVDPLLDDCTTLEQLVEAANALEQGNAAVSAAAKHQYEANVKYEPPMATAE